MNNIHKTPKEYKNIALKALEKAKNLEQRQIANGAVWETIDGKTRSLSRKRIFVKDNEGVA